MGIFQGEPLVLLIESMYSTKVYGVSSIGQVGEARGSQPRLAIFEGN